MMSIVLLTACLLPLVGKAAEVCDNITVIHCPVPLPVYNTNKFILV